MPCLSAVKSDGSGYCKVNGVTVPDCVDNLRTAQYLSKVDLHQGYWQILLTGVRRRFATFVTSVGFLQYAVMVFGMCNAPASFQRFVKSVLSGVPQCNTYLDNLIVDTAEWDEHMHIFEQVFSCFTEASLTLNLAKCEFGQATVTYWGDRWARAMFVLFKLRYKLLWRIWFLPPEKLYGGFWGWQLITELSVPRLTSSGCPSVRLHLTVRFFIATCSGARCT